MLERNITEKLISWKNQKNKKALCIIGARQTGKTTTIREFAKEQYEYFVEINFILDKGAEKIFGGLTVLKGDGHGGSSFIKTDVRSMSQNGAKNTNT